MVDPHEVSELRSRYGEPLVWTRTMEVGANLIEKRLRALETKRGETVLVIPRPGNRVLLHTKAFYPPGAFRLLSGGIERKESVLDAVHRELDEETGFKVNPLRFLGIVEYTLVNGGTSLSWVSYVIQTEETHQAPQSADAHEQISAFRETDVGNLPDVAENLEHLEGDWEDWGRFRAMPHRLAWLALSQ